MATSIKELIIQNMQTAVRAVKKKDSYDNDLEYGAVKRGDNSTINLAVMPSVFIFEGDETTDDREFAGANTLIHLELEVMVELWVSAEEDLSIAINSLEADVIKAVMVDAGRGGYALTTELGGSTPFFLEGQAKGGRIISFVITYVRKETDPYSQ